MARLDEAYTKEEFEHFKNILSNGTARIPVCFCIDVSKSMGWLTNPRTDYKVVGKEYEDGRLVDAIKLKDDVKPKSKLDDLKTVLKKLIDGLHNEPELRDTAVVSIVTFSKYADTIINFCEPASLDSESIVKQIRLGVEVTNVSEGINLALTKLSAMYNVLHNAQAESFKPVFILISDGAPTDDIKAEIAVSKLTNASINEGLSIIPIGIYMDYSGKEWLCRLRADGKIYTMNHDDDFEKVFDMIKQLVVFKAPIISADEDIMADNKFAKEKDIPTTAYGQTSSPDDLLKYFEFPDDV